MCLFSSSDPFHERYGQHLTKAEVDALIAPPEETIDFIDGWLASYDIHEEDFTRSSAKDWITVNVPVHMAEKMLDTVSLGTRIRACGVLLGRTHSITFD